MPKTVLIVDDSATMRQMVSFTLKQAGFAVLEAGDGQQGLERLAGARVDLIVTDLNMPRMDGIELIRHVRSLAASKHLPILMLTTESQQEKRQQGRAAGATGWMVKPFEPQKLLQTIAKVLP
jgi:two-component system, chemotaxis family, chemotaxis protein CheY